jgi:carboxypeptidase D
MLGLPSNLATAFAVLLATQSTAKIFNGPVPKQPKFAKRNILANATDMKTITSPTGVKVRYKELRKEGVCETPGANSYSGYIDLSEDQHTFFWFFESRPNPSRGPIALCKSSAQQ